MQQFQQVCKTLKEMEIEYRLVEHAPALTTEEADKYIEGIEGVRTKTLFLSNRKKTQYYLLVMDDAKRLDMKKLGEMINEKGMKFVNAEILLEKMSLLPGIVSPFGLINNIERDINVCLDKEMLTEAFMSFHANINTKTIFITTKDMYKFIKNLNYEYQIVDL